MLQTTPESESVARAPTGFEVVVDRIFRGLAISFAAGTVLLLGWIVFVIGAEAGPAMSRYGANFLTDTVWDPTRGEFSILPEIHGTLYTSILALAIGGTLGIIAAIFLSQGFLPAKLERVMKNIIELLAAIPSVVYGLWGIFFVIPAIKPIADWLHESMGWFPLFGTELIGPGFLPASLVLAIMILPTVTAISREAMVAVPGKLKEAAYGLGATRWETIRKVVLPTSSTGVFGAVVLGFGRALGETMALAMLVGNDNQLSWSLFSPGNTLASLLANYFPEANELEVGALMYAALVLLLITLSVNIIGAVIMARAGRHTKGLN